MDHGPASIPVRSETQAMEWSLVLVSQGIESVLRQDPETGRWRLEVNPDDLPRARATLRCYLMENRNRRWRSEVEWSGDLYDWRCWWWGVFLSAMFLLQELLPADLRHAGRMDGQAVLLGEWWRLFTATTLHADEVHLCANLATGILLLGFAMGAYGAGAALLASFLAGALGNLTALITHGPAHLSLGASGAVMGALGLLCAHAAATSHNQPRRYWLSRGIMGAVMLTVLIGLTPGTDITAHLGGLVGGCLLGGVLLWSPLRIHRRLELADGWLAMSTGLLLALTWALALTRPQS